MRKPLVVAAAVGGVVLGLGLAELASADAPRAGAAVSRQGCFTQASISGIAPGPDGAVYVRVNNREFHRVAVRGACPNLDRAHWPRRAALLGGTGEWFCPGDTAWLYSPARGLEDRCPVEIGPSLTAR
jgi:hypothetical protein